MTTASSRSPYDYSTGVPALQAVEARMILIAGADLCQMEAAASVIFDAGHVPVIAPWFTEPLVALSAFEAGTEESVDQILQPLTDRLIARCDAILRVGGASAAADAMAGAGRARGLRVFHDVKEALDG